MKSEIKHYRVSWTGTDGETKFESTLWMIDGVDSISDMTGQIEMLAEGYDVSIEEIECKVISFE